MIINKKWFGAVEDTWAQFHQRFLRSFYVRKFRTLFFCAYILGLYFTCPRLLAQKLCVER
jgi:hypothetical protein